MPLSAAQKTAIDEVITVITSTKDKRGKRNLSDMFLEMVNKDDMPEYYEASDAATVYGMTPNPGLMQAL